MSQKYVRARPRTLRKIAEEPAGEIDQVRALVDQFAAAGERRVGAPFAIVAGSSAVTIAAADKHHLAQRAAFKDLARPAECAVIAVIEADADQRSGAPRGFGHRVKFAGRARSRLFDQHVLTGGRRLGRDRRQLIVRRRDEDGVDIVAPHRRLPVRGRRGAGRVSGQSGGARRVDIAAYRHAPGRKRGGALASNQSAADDGRAHSGFRGQNAL